MLANFIFESTIALTETVFCFSLQNSTKAMRLFVGEPVWKAYNRPADDFDTRKAYVNSLRCS